MAISCAYSCMVTHPKLLILFNFKNIINIFVLSFSIPELTSFVIEKLKIYRHFYIFFLNFFSILSLIDYIQGLLINFNFLTINDLYCIKIGQFAQNDKKERHTLSPNTYTNIIYHTPNKLLFHATYIKHNIKQILYIVQ